MFFMRPQRLVLRLVVAAFFIAAISANSAFAFYEYNSGDLSVDMRAMLRAYVSYSKNPDSPLSSQPLDNTIATPAARLMISASAGEHAAFDFNGLLYSIHGSTPLSAAADTERNGALDWVVRDSSSQRSRFSIDHAFFRFSKDLVDLRIGRQPVNLSTCFYFTPNDFFAPFAANAFFREFKPGVDSARIDVRLGELSELTLLHVLGYAPDASSANGWSGGPGSSRSSTIIRLSAAALGFEWAALAGRNAGDGIIGASAQGELFKWLGVRAEGHRRNSASGALYEISAGVEHKFASSLFLRYEFFYHGAGAADPSHYSVAAPPMGYMGRQYGALGLGYEFSPLLNGQALYLQNYGDNSEMIALYGVYSLADDAEFSFGFNLPGGGSATVAGPASEFGLYPQSAFADVRIYF